MTAKNNHRNILLGLAALVFAVVLLVTFLNDRPNNAFNIGVSLFQAGHYKDFYSSHFVLLFVTNNTAHPIQLEGGTRQCVRPNGTMLQNNNVQWNGTSVPAVISSQGMAETPLEVEKQFVKYRLIFDYSHDAGLVHSFLSKGVRKLPQKFLGAKVVSWLWEHGLIDGRVHRRYETPWMTNGPVQPTKASRPAGESKPLGVIAPHSHEAL